MSDRCFRLYRLSIAFSGCCDIMRDERSARCRLELAKRKLYGALLLTAQPFGRLGGFRRACLRVWRNRLLVSLARRTPPWIHSDHLTLLGLGTSDKVVAMQNDMHRTPLGSASLVVPVFFLLQLAVSSTLGAQDAPRTEFFVLAGSGFGGDLATGEEFESVWTWGVGVSFRPHRFVGVSAEVSRAHNEQAGSLPGGFTRRIEHETYFVSANMLLYFARHPKVEPYFFVGGGLVTSGEVSEGYNFVEERPVVSRERESHSLGDGWWRRENPVFQKHRHGPGFGCPITLSGAPFPRSLVGDQPCEGSIRFDEQMV